MILYNEVNKDQDSAFLNNREMPMEHIEVLTDVDTTYDSGDMYFITETLIMYYTIFGIIIIYFPEGKLRRRNFFIIKTQVPKIIVDEFKVNTNYTFGLRINYTSSIK